MKRSVLLILLTLFTFQIHAQENDTEEEPKDYSANVLTLDSTIKSLYSVISGEKDVERDWDLFKFLFRKDAKLIAAGKNKEGELQVQYMKPADYIKNSGKWLVENGFFEKEINRVTDKFGNMAHVFSTYESFFSEDDEKPFMRGINSIQLFYDGKRWWIVNIYWQQESKKHTIPETYLN